MPTPKRPQPEFPAQGFLGALPNLGGGYSSEYSITIPHPTMPGHWTNVPLLVPGQEGTNALPGPVTDEQVRRAEQFGRFLAQTGYQLPAFKTPDEAAFQAGHRHKSFEGSQTAQPSQEQGAPATDTDKGLMAVLRQAFGF
jgi:hypothetical protein